MSIDFIRPEVDELRPRISVIGVGGAGGNAIANMMRADVQGVDFVVANTDAQALNASLADRRIQLGLKITQGLGAGSRPEIGRAAAEETLDEIVASLEGAHMCFIAAGMGGGTGTGAAPVPVPPPIPAAMKHMCAPSSAAMISSSDSSAAARPISGREPAPSPWVIFRPSWIRRSASEELSAWASVLATTKSTPCTSARIMLAMALPPAPPTPMTLIRGRSSSTSGRMKSMLMSPIPSQTATR